MKRHQFQQHARHFRSGRVSLNELTEFVFGDSKEVAAVVSPVSSAPDEEVIVASVASDVSIPQLRPRPVDAHKGNFGHVLAIGGSRGMGGAIGLTAMAAIRSGCGLVTAAVPESVAEIVAGYDPCMMTLACRESDGHFSSVTDALRKMMESSSVIAVGPGMGRNVDRYFLESVLESALPVVMDADAIHLLADAHLSISRRDAATVLTPHPGEFSNLTNREFADRTEMENAATEYAKENECIVVLKGNGTLVTDGAREFRNASGNVGMATGGSGDVLTGVVASLIGQGYEPFDAAVLGVHIHGRAGDFAAEELGQVSMVASDLLDSLSSAFKSQLAVGGAELRIGF
jgi:NAD(P)H-hydrate epimerase